MKPGYVLIETYGGQFWSGTGWVNSATHALVFPSARAALAEASVCARRLSVQVVDAWDLEVEVAVPFELAA